jgi:hypothetical protein
MLEPRKGAPHRLLFYAAMGMANRRVPLEELAGLNTESSLPCEFLSSILEATIQVTFSKPVGKSARNPMGTGAFAGASPEIPPFL